MKALDTSVLLALLEGDHRARPLIKRLRGVEVATTEANLLELALLAARSPANSRAGRREALSRLRRRVTVLPLDSKAGEATSVHLSRTREALAPLVAAMMGALESSGCDELWTLDPPAELGKWRVRVTRLHFGNTK